MTFFEIPIGTWDSGLIALALNVVVVVVAETLRRRLQPAAMTQVLESV